MDMTEGSSPAFARCRGDRVALVVGFRATASPVEWMAAAGVLLVTTLAITWLAVALVCSPRP